MSRPDARSVSYTHVRLRENSGTMDYAPRNGDDTFATSFVTTLAVDCCK